MGLGEYIKNLRTGKEFSQRELAELAGISSAEISRVESGERKNPAPKILKAIAPYLGVPYEEILREAGYIEEVIEHKGYTENVYRDANGKVVDIYREAKVINETDREWGYLSFRVATENLTQEQRDFIKAQTEFTLEQFLKNNKK